MGFVNLFDVLIDFSMFWLIFSNGLIVFQCFDWCFNVLFDFLQRFLLMCSMLFIVLFQCFV